MASSSSSRPTPQLLWQVLIVLSTCSSTTFDSSTTVCTSSCASSRCLNTCSPFCRFKPTSFCDSLRVVRNLYPVTDVLRHMRPLLLTSTRSDRGLFLLPDDARLPVGLVIGCPIISRLEDRHVPIIHRVALPVLNSCAIPEDVRPSLRSPSQGSFRQPTWRPSCISCMHQLCDFSVACSTSCS